MKQKKSPGRPRKTTAKTDRWITLSSKKNRFATITDIAKVVKDSLGVNVSRHIVS